MSEVVSWSPGDTEGQPGSRLSCIPAPRSEYTARTRLFPGHRVPAVLGPGISPRRGSDDGRNTSATIPNGSRRDSASNDVSASARCIAPMAWSGECGGRLGGVAACAQARNTAGTAPAPPPGASGSVSIAVPVVASDTPACGNASSTMVPATVLALPGVGVRPGRAADGRPCHPCGGISGWGGCGPAPPGRCAWADDAVGTQPTLDARRGRRAGSVSAGGTATRVRRARA